MIADLSLRKSLGLVGAEAKSMPIDVRSSFIRYIACGRNADTLPDCITQITLETLVSFIVILVGIALTALPLKNVTWASEMRTK